MSKISFLPFLLLLLLSSCTGIFERPLPATFQNSHKGDFGEGGFLTGEPCGPPCFWGITPGVSTEDDLIKKANANDVFSQCMIFDYKKQGGIRGLYCRSIPMGFTDEGTVGDITFYPSVDITLAQLIDLYGIPDGVYVDLISLPDASPRVAMTLWYKKINSRVIIEQNSIDFVANPESVVERIEYFEKGDFEQSCFLLRVKLPNGQDMEYMNNCSPARRGSVTPPSFDRQVP